MNRMDVKISPSTSQHVDYIAANIRKADEQEIWDMALLKPKEALKEALEVSDFVSTGFINNQIVGMCGLVRLSLLSDRGRPWMISTSALDNKRYALDFHRMGKRVVAAMIAIFPYLENYVEASNKRTIKWLKSLGFQFDEPQKMGPLGKPFIRFYMERNGLH
jgi:hypothetical protein